MKVTFSCLVLYFLLAARGVRLSGVVTKQLTPPKDYKDIIKSVYGKYNPGECCWKDGPKAPRLEVDHDCQSESVRQEIEYKLSKYPAVEQALMKSAVKCENNHWGSEGLSDSCPSKYLRATEVKRWGIVWYIVRPNAQCVTYRKCFAKKNCAMIDKTERKRGAVPKSQCGEESESTCLPDGYRTFQVWIYCRLYGFRLVDLELPQCCSCKRYNACY